MATRKSAPVRSAAQESLKISEILDNVFTHLLEEDNGRKTLLSLALACKDFSGPALDVLWRDMPCIMPLLRLLSTLRATLPIQSFLGVIPAFVSQYSRFRLNLLLTDYVCVISIFSV